MCLCLGYQVLYVLVSRVSGALCDCVWGIRCFMCLCLRYEVLYVIVSGYIVFYVIVSRVYGTLYDLSRLYGARFIRHIRLSHTAVDRSL